MSGRVSVSSAHLQRDGASARSVALVEGPGQFSVGGPCGFQFVGPLVELALDVGEILLQHRDALLELVDVGWRAQPGLGPDGLAEGLGEALLQLPDPHGKAFVPFQCVGQLGLQ